jgi:hypothetical protein
VAAWLTRETFRQDYRAGNDEFAGAGQPRVSSGISTRPRNSGGQRQEEGMAGLFLGVDFPCEADGRKLRVTVLHPWHGTHSGAGRGVGQRRNVRGDRRELPEFRRIEKHRFGL